MVRASLWIIVLARYKRIYGTMALADSCWKLYND